MTSRIAEPMNALDLVYLPLAVATSPWWARKARGGWAERFGKVDALPPKPAGVARVLLHAVSVGEVSTLRTLVPLLRERGLEVVVSASTDTGLERARALYANIPGVFVVRYALDFSPAVHRFLDAINVDGVALVELEVWPNFVAMCERRGIPVGVINGRLSARSFRGYSRLRSFFRRSFSRLAFACVQDADYAQRFIAMGVEPSRVSVTGNMKWDATKIVDPGPGGINEPGAAALAREMGIDLSRPLIVAGSTAPAGDTCEEALLHAACPEGVQLLCAPRKPEHREAAFAALGGPTRCVRRTSKSTQPGADRFLLDTIGELRAAYALASIVVVGRTFGDLGGSDPIEPISLCKPTVLGPEYANFEAVVNEFKNRNAIVITSRGQLKVVIAELLADQDRCSSLIESGQEVILANQGASRAHADRICKDLVRIFQG